MKQIFNIDLKKMSADSNEEATDRKKNFELFLKNGLPNKKDESWKFSDLNFIINGAFKSCDIKFEEKSKVKINSLNSYEDFNNHSTNNLYYLNKALSIGGFSLEIEKNYKCKKPIIIYNYFSSNLDNKIINNSNKIKLNQNSELTFKILYSAQDLNLIK